MYGKERGRRGTRINGNYTDGGGRRNLALPGSGGAAHRRAAEEGFRRAIALNPGYAPAHHGYGDSLGGRGDLEGFLQELRLVHALDPLSRQLRVAVTAEPAVRGA
ncbi:hypothetical protein BH23GEM3_BH23GEM3_10330 [soil metagenome]